MPIVLLQSRLSNVGVAPLPGDWILTTGFWNDSGRWIDTAFWID